jgi:hypothetical protein
VNDQAATPDAVDQNARAGVMVELLQAILDKLAVIADVLSSGAGPERPRVTLTDTERGVLALLLPAISAAVGDRLFTVRDLLEHATTVDPELRIALECATFKLDAGSARRIGKRLQRAQGLPMNGFSLVRHEAKDRDGVVWQIRANVRLSNSRQIR